MNTRFTQGFSWVTIMLALAVLATLLWLALPIYQEKIVREQIAEGLPLADIAKAPVAASWSAGRPYPTDNTAAGLPAPDRMLNNFVQSLAIKDGAVHLTFGNQAHDTLRGKVLTLRPAVVPAAPIVPVVWVCGYAAAPAKMSVQGENRTNVPADLLPQKCRACWRQIDPSGVFYSALARR